jgi:hypothetical protein
MNLPRSLVFFPLFALVLPVSAQEAKPKPAAKGIAVLAANEISAVAPATADNAPAQLAAQFFASLREGEIELAYTVLTRGSKIGDRPDELRLLKQKTKEAIEVFGVISGHELVENRTVGTRLMRATYISLGKEFPLRWRFYFYKADSVWRLVDLRVDDKLTGIFEELEETKAEVK